MPLDNIDLDTDTMLCIDPEFDPLPYITEVDWSLIEDRVEASIDAWGIHAAREHYFAGIWAYEDQMGGCPGIIARDMIAPIVDKLIAERF